MTRFFGMISVALLLIAVARGAEDGPRSSLLGGGAVFVPQPARCAAFSPDGRLLALGGRKATITLWDTTQNKQRSLLRQDADREVLSVSFSTDGRLLRSLSRSTAGADERGEARLWDVRTGKEIYRHSARDAAFSSDLRMVAEVALPDRIRLIDPRTGKELRTLRCPGDPSGPGTFAPDGRTLATVVNAHTVCLWEVATGKLLRSRRWEGREVGDLAFLPDGRLLVTTYRGSYEEGVPFAILSDLERKEPLLHAGVLLWGPVSSDGKLLAGFSGYGVCGAGSLALWDLSADRRHFLAGGVLDFWSLASDRKDRLRVREIVADLPVVFSPNHRVVAACWSTEAVREGAVQVWDTRTGKPACRIAIPGGANSIAFSPDGKRLVVGGSHCWVMLDTSGLRGMGGPASALAFSADGKLVAGGDASGLVQVWSPATGKEVHRFRGGRRVVEGLVFAPDGQALAAASEDENVRLWDLRSGRRRHRLEGWGSETITGFGFSADGKQVLLERIIDKKWDVATGEEIKDPLPELEAKEK